jgi:putative zinc finger protein
MKCSEAEYLSPLYLSGELDAQFIVELDLHLKECSTCSREFELQREMDATLRDCLRSEAVDADAVRERIRQKLWPPHPLWKSFSKRNLGSAAAVVALVVVGFTVWNIFASRTDNVSTVYAAAAADHHQDVIGHPDGWLDGDFQIAEFAQVHGVNAALITAIAPEGYRVDRVRLCKLAQADYVHLVYSNGKSEISFFVRRRDKEKLVGNPITMVKDTEVYSETADALYVAGFQSRRYIILTVTDQSPARALRFATNAAESGA